VVRARQKEFPEEEVQIKYRRQLLRQELVPHGRKGKELLPLLPRGGDADLLSCRPVEDWHWLGVLVEVAAAVRHAADPGSRCMPGGVPGRGCPDPGPAGLGLRPGPAFLCLVFLFHSFFSPSPTNMLLLLLARLLSVLYPIQPLGYLPSRVSSTSGFQFPLVTAERDG
jgi:hypothetical protein